MKTKRTDLFKVIDPPLKIESLLPAMSKNEDRLQRLNEELLVNIKEHLPQLEELLNSISEDHTYGDMVYRYYHQSIKVFWVQQATVKIVMALKALAPEGAKEGNWLFEEILKEGTGKTFKYEYNAEWSKHARPLLEAFFHAKYFLEMAVKYGKELEHAPQGLPSGWAGLLYFFDMR